MIPSVYPMAGRATNLQRHLAVLWIALFAASIILPFTALTAPSPALALAGTSFNALDGNLTLEGPETDWCTPGLGVVTKHDLPTGQTDDSYAEGAKENDLNPAVEFGSIPNNKVDLTRIYVASQTISGNLFAYVGWVRSDTSGTGTISFELNQSGITLSNGVNQQRTVGDLLIEFHFQANPGSQGGYQVTLLYRTWGGTAWSEALSLSGLADGSVNDSNVIDCVEGGTLATGSFGEFALNLSGLVGSECRSFVSIFAKSRASNQITSALKELVKPAGVDFTTCGQITILKHDGSGAALGGATFTITPNPFTKNGSLEVTDNQAPDDDPAAGTIHLSDVEPGTYEVCEQSAPAGYIKQTACETQTVIDNGAVTFGPFVNTLGEISWEKRDADAAGNPFICCATFLLEGIGGAATGFSRSVTDDGANDEDSAAGQLKVTGLKLGTYRISETAAPTGYTLPEAANHIQTVELTGASASAASAFLDPRKLTNLTVEKRDATSNALIDTATFKLWLDDGDGVLDAGDTLVGSQVSTSGGTYTWADLDFGTYHIEETEAPQGYGLPAGSVQTATINAANAGVAQTVTFRDPRQPTDVTVRKLDATSQELIDAAKFQLWLDVDDNGELEKNAPDTKIGGEVSTSGGTYTWTDLDFGAYIIEEVEAPQGYDLPAATTVAFVINAGNAGGTLSFDFLDPRKLSELVVKKVDASDPETSLGGATFQLWMVGAPDALIGSCVSGAGGTCSIGSLGFGTYYWIETEAPTGYDLPANATSSTITIDASNAGTELTVTVFSDPRQPGMIMAEKIDDADGAPLAGALFELRSGSIEGAKVAEATSNANGQAAFANVDFGTYWVVEVQAPAGYELPEDASCGPITIGAEHLSDTTTCTGENAFVDVEKPAQLDLDKQVAPEGTLSSVGDGPKGDSMTVDLFVDHGASVVYHYLVINNGEQTIEGIEIHDDRVASSAITCPKTTLHPAEAMLCLSDPQPVTQLVENTAQASGTFTTAGGTRDIDSDQDRIIVDARSASITKSNDAIGSVVPGTAVGFSLELAVTNGPLPGLTVVDQLPDGLGAGHAVSHGGTYSSATNSITWDLTDVADGTTLTYRATVLLSTTAGEYRNVATITEGPCVEECEDDSTVTVRVPTLVIDKAASVEQVSFTLDEAGSVTSISPAVVAWTLSWTLTDGPVTSAVISDPIPAFLTYVEGSATDGGVFDAATNTLTWTFASLTESGSVTFQTSVDEEASGEIENVATIVSDQTAEDEGFASITVTEQVVLGPTPPPSPKIPDTAAPSVLGGQTAMVVPLALLALLFSGSLGTLALVNVKAARRRR